MKDRSKIMNAIKEINRELKQRESIYPRLIQAGKLHRDRANRQYLRLRFARDYLQSVLDESRVEPATQTQLPFNNQSQQP